MMHGYRMAYVNRLSRSLPYTAFTMKKDPSRTETKANTPEQKVHRQTCNTAKGETKLQESEICTSFYKDLHVQLEQVWCFRCFRCLRYMRVWELLGRGISKRRSSSLQGQTVGCVILLFSVVQNLGGPNSNNTKYPLNVRRQQSRRSTPPNTRGRRVGNTGQPTRINSRQKLAC